jgi:tetratricopeptide (TPR) repeat protein
MDRIAAFKSFIERSPADPFPRYGLAMEYKNQGRLAEACEAFRALVEAMPDYVPTYLMYGNTLAQAGDRDGATEIYRRGIEVSGQRGDLHARGELEGALADLELSE